MPRTLDEHVHYTEHEWENEQYFTNVLNFLKTKNIKKILDVGGCTGKVSSILLKKIKSIEEIIILEPIQENFNFIKNQISFSDKIKVIQKGLFYGSPYIELGRCDDNVGGWSISHDLGKTTQVETITLEEFFNLDFVKIDIEGAEKNVIENSSYLHNIPYIEIEFHFDLFSNWKNYIEQNLPNHKLKFSSESNRSNGFFVRTDLF